MAMLELDDIQSGVLRPRPTPFAATYIVVRIDDRAGGRALMRRLSEIVASAAHPESPARDTWVSASLSFAGLQALGVPQASLDSFPPHNFAKVWRRARDSCTTLERTLPNIGRSRSARTTCTSSSREFRRIHRRWKGRSRARKTFIENTPGITQIWRQNCHALPDETEPFGFKDGISHPAIEGSGIPGTNPLEIPLKPGEFVLGYTDEFGGIPAVPQPEVLGRNGSYIVFRKLYQRVAAFGNILKRTPRAPKTKSFWPQK